MDFESLKKMFHSSVPPSARKHVIAYAMQAAVLGEIEKQALAAGATKVSMEMVKAALPMLLPFLEESASKG